MVKIDLDSMSIEERAKLRENINTKITEKVGARQLKLEADMDRRSECGKSAKKSATSLPTEAKKNEPKKINEPGGAGIAGRGCGVSFSTRGSFGQAKAKSGSVVL